MTKENNVLARNNGQFAQGNSEGGRTKKDIELEAHARLHAKYAIDTAVSILMNTEATNQDRLKAAAMILDRGHGKPKETVSVTHERPVTELSEADLITIIASGGSTGTTRQKAIAAKPDPVH